MSNMYRRPVKDLEHRLSKISDALVRARIREDVDPWALPPLGSMWIPMRAVLVASIRKLPLVIIGGIDCGMDALAAGAARIGVPSIMGYRCKCGYFGHYYTTCGCTNFRINEATRKLLAITDRAVWCYCMNLSLRDQTRVGPGTARLYEDVEQARKNVRPELHIDEQMDTLIKAAHQAGLPAEMRPFLLDLMLDVAQLDAQPVGIHYLAEAVRYTKWSVMRSAQ